MTKVRAGANRYFAGQLKSASRKVCGSHPSQNPGFPVNHGYVNELRAAFLEGRTRGPNWCSEVGNPGQSEGWAEIGDSMGIVREFGTQFASAASRTASATAAASRVERTSCTLTSAAPARMAAVTAARDALPRHPTGTSTPW
jgi:hypothetical protein